MACGSGTACSGYLVARVAVKRSQGLEQRGGLFNIDPAIFIETAHGIASLDER